MASEYGEGMYPPLATVGSNDHGGYVLVVAYTFLSLEVITVIARLRIRMLNLDDASIVAALVSCMDTECSPSTPLIHNHRFLRLQMSSACSKPSPLG